MPHVFTIKISKKFEDYLSFQSHEYRNKVWKANMEILTNVKLGNYCDECPEPSLHAQRRRFRRKVEGYKEFTYMLLTPGNQAAFIGIRKY